MKVIFNFPCTGAFLTALVVSGGCVRLEVDPVDIFEGEGLPEEVKTCVGCLAEQELRGELMLLVNTRLSNPRANYTANFPIDGEGRYVGPALYLYDPTRTCDDGGSECRLAHLGSAWFDDHLGPISVGDGSLERLTLRDLAWDPVRGLWGMTFDALNDEWGLAALEVPDLHRVDNHIGVRRYTFMPGPVSSSETDHCYWREALRGLGFVGGELYVGAAGKPGNGFDATGAIFAVPGDFLDDPRHCVFPNDRTQDPEYYVCRPLCTTVADFPEWLGIAGDITDTVDGGLLAAVSGENPEVMPADRNVLFTVDVAAGEAPKASPVTIDRIIAGRNIEGLARLGGVLYGVDPQGLVYAIVEPTAEAPGAWSVTIHDDLAPLFVDAEETIRFRGATRIVVD